MQLALSIVVLTLPLFHFSQKSLEEDSLRNNTNKNLVYVVPSSIRGDLWWDLNEMWLDVGASRNVNKNNFLDLRLALIVSSSKAFRNNLSSIHAEKSSGWNISLEHKYLIKKHFYYASVLSYQLTNISRLGEYDKHAFKMVNEDNLYSVKRNVCALTPKIGWMWINRQRLFFDIGIGAGVRIIQSKSKGKINSSLNSGTEYFSGKNFDDGTNFSQRIILQFKTGINF